MKNLSEIFDFANFFSDVLPGQSYLHKVEYSASTITAKAKEQAEAAARKSGSYLSLLLADVYSFGDALRSRRILCIMVYYLKQYGNVPPELAAYLESATKHGKRDLEALRAEFNNLSNPSKRERFILEQQMAIKLRGAQELEKKLAEFDAKAKEK